MGDMTVKQGEVARAAIKVGMLVKRLNDHAEGVEGVDMSPTQVAAAKILLGKVLPDSQSIDVTAHSSPENVSEEALIASLKALIARDPSIISALGHSNGAYALPAPSVEVGNTTSDASHQPIE